MDSTTYIFAISMTVFIGASLYVWFRFFKKETRRELASETNNVTSL
jgi:hypothetical protein